MVDQLIKLLRSTKGVARFSSAVTSASPGEPIRISGLAGSLRALAIALLLEDMRRQILIVLADEESAERLMDDLHVILGQPHVRLFLLPHGASSLDEPSGSAVGDIETLRWLLDANTGIVLTHAAAFSSAIPNPSSLSQQLIKIETGKQCSLTSLRQQLAVFGFEKKQFVDSVGDYSLRGGILDVYPFVGENPIRIEFFGDTVESLREFDPLSQRSIKELSSAIIVPDLLTSQAPPQQASSTILDFLQPDAIIVLEEPDAFKSVVASATTRSKHPQLIWKEMTEMLGMFRQVHFSSLSDAGVESMDFGSNSQPAINGSIKIMRDHLIDLQSRGFRIFITCDTLAEQERLKSLVTELEPIVADEERAGHIREHCLDITRIQFSLESLHGGFILPDAKLALFTEHQIFNRLKRRGKPRRAKFKGLSQKGLHELRKGDYVVHADYGVGRYDGLKRIKVRDAEQEVVKLLYEEKDTLYVNLNYINKIQKYASKEGHIPKLTRLGGGEWERLKARTKKRVQDIARDLIRLYAKRKHAQGFVFHKDTLWQRELEASFVYEDTPDQEKATTDIKQDMEASFPMDRLICGDVGFGKTEVAVRAAFKAVMSGKQAAVLVPTTILAQQHYNTFIDRLSKYSTRIDVISRFRSKKEQSEILDRVRNGSTDIVIGTHRLLSKDVSFKDLGLLVVDEEHRFGVAAKEKLRLFKANVDTLTLTATPIPRTLHFSLMGARDLSIIATPPPNRLPVITEIAQYNEEHVRDAILHEVHRDGQVFFVHDRVNNMDEVLVRLQAILPQVRFRPAHGQMRAHELEDVMLAFLEKKFDVLVATKIIESGIDMPSVNTIIINRADRFGMAELYQLRGRVGRSNVQAYAYLLIPPVSVLPRETVRRLQAVEEFTELGSGFNLAMRDLEIRGAGNLLGGEQSGFIESMGFEMYAKILEEAVAELKEQEFQELFEHHEAKHATRQQTVVEANIDVRIPESYIESENERLLIYRRFFSVSNDVQLNEIAIELTDRFGKHPVEVENLFKLVRIRLKASELGFRKVNISADGVTLEFPPESESEFYEADGFQLLMSHISRQRSRTHLRQNGKTLHLSHTFKNLKEANPFAETGLLIDELIEASKSVRN